MSEDKPRYSRLSDLLDLAVYMASRSQGVTIDMVMNRYNVSRRTAERMRNGLTAIFPQIDVIKIDGVKKYWGFINFSISELVTFLPSEIACLVRLRKQSSNSKVKDELLRIIEKIKVVMNRKNLPDLHANLELLMRTEGFAVRQTPQFNIEPCVFDIIRKAIKNSFVLKATYHDKPRELEPLGIIYGDKSYLVAYEKSKGDGIYNYLLHKISDLELTNKKFNRKGFNLQKYTNQSFGVYHDEILDVKLLFSKDIAQTVKEYNFHPTQELDEDKDGNILVSFKASGTREIMRHVFKWGKDCKIISPEKLKNEYVQCLKENLNNYL